ncbi:unnamed protein product [Rotaria sordida]|uniref:Uncharacterized protein n=1 Tax=Rotaria sordida TaxID=392033 RepID=A0A815K2P3_9BILA|nr:unnamed protein product [Rotaria sordida]
MAFIHGFNVNSEQRDQYISDTINVNTGPIVGKLSMIQSPKPSKQKYGSRLPRFRIGGDELKNDINHTLAFLAYIVSDFYPMKYFSQDITYLMWSIFWMFRAI